MGFLLKKVLNLKSHHLQIIIAKNILGTPNNLDHKDGKVNVIKFHLLH